MPDHRTALPRDDDATHLSRFFRARFVKHIVVFRIITTQPADLRFASEAFEEQWE
jgi:hypothetical protein